ncbi:MAG: urease accessory protein UreD [Ferruginibacter sp.]|nr:urease accessory protein UreD [Ferruginibacter sp.]
MDKKICFTRRHQRTRITKMNGRLEIQTIYRNNKTILKDSFMSPPFKLADITENKKSSMLELMMMSSSPGTLDKDNLNIDILIDENCSVILSTQSYQRIFNMKDSATQHTNIKMRQNGFLSHIPHPTVPHKNANYTTINNIYLENSSTLIWGELLTCGRKLNNEIFLFNKMHSITNVYCENNLIIRENLLMEPSTMNLSAIGQLEGYTHQASLICFNNKMDNEETKNSVYELLNAHTEIKFGISNATAHSIKVRILGRHAEELFDILNKINKLLTVSTITDKNKSLV